MVSTINEWMVSTYDSEFRDREGLMLVNLESLSVEESQELRNSIRATGAHMRVTKNSLARVALKEVGIEFDTESWGGMCALVVGDVESTISAAKAIEDLWGKNPERKVSYRGAVLDGSQMSAAEAAGIAKMPDKNTLRAMMCGALVGPARQIAALLSEVPASTARVLNARIDAGGAGSDQADAGESAE
jgi:large subunit ribosomal protein L10